MSVVEPEPSASSLLDRAKNLILQPTAEWTKIDPEKPTVQSLYMGWIVPMAAIPAAAQIIGGIAFGYGGFGFSIRPSPVTVLVTGVVQYALTLVMVYVMALIIDGLANSFGAKKDQIQALKVAAYSATAGWLAGIFAIYPPLGILSILGLYSLFLLYRGLPILMKAPAERAMGYTVTIVIVTIVLAIVIGALTSCIGGVGRVAGLGAVGALGQHEEAKVEGKITVPGGGTIDLSEMQRATEQLEKQANAMDGTGAPAVNVAPEALKALLPDALPGGFARTEISTGSGGVAGFNGTTATGKYARGESTLELSVIDMGAAGALASMASAFNVNSSTENNDGYEKVNTVDGRFTTEKVSKSAKTAEYITIVAKRFALAVEGTGVSIDDVKAAANAIGVAKLEALAAANAG